MPEPAPIKVTHLIAPVAFGGGEALLADLLSTRRPDLSESVITVGRAPILTATLAEHGISCHALGDAEVGAERAGRLRELAFSLSLVRPLRAHLRKAPPDVVHAHGFPPSLLARLALPAEACAVYTHHYERRPPGVVETKALTNLFSRYQALTTPADHLTTAMNRHFPALPRPFTTLRIGLNERFYSGQAQARWREQFADGTSIGVCVGRLVASKNQELIIRALASMPPEDRHRIGVLLVGDGPEEGTLRSQVDALGLNDHIRFLGQLPREEMPDLLSSVDFGIFPTLTEASSLAAAEALAGGLPVLALDIPSMRETVGSAGILTDRSSFAADLARMGRCHHTLTAAARERGEASRVSRVRSAWAALYQDVAGAPGATAGS